VINFVVIFCGRERTRTSDLLDVNETLCQLSYPPTASKTQIATNDKRIATNNSLSLVLLIFFYSLPFVIKFVGIRVLFYYITIFLSNNLKKFSKSLATKIGPVPPGVGVIKLALFFNFSKLISP
jgi:hypothetical protein